MLNKLAIIGGLLLIIVICYSLVKQTYDSLKIESRIEEETEKLLSLQKVNFELKKQLEQARSISFIESQARDRFNFSRSGETVVIIPDTELEKILGAAKEKQKEILPNWQGWLKLFWK